LDTWRSEGSTAANVLGRGAVAGVAGTVVMTAFQKFGEMPITGRSDSYAPADFVEKVFRLAPGTRAARRRLNNATHLALGTMWAGVPRNLRASASNLPPSERRRSERRASDATLEERAPRAVFKFDRGRVGR